MGRQREGQKKHGEAQKKHRETERGTEETWGDGVRDGRNRGRDRRNMGRQREGQKKHGVGVGMGLESTLNGLPPMVQKTESSHQRRRS